ncbi:hypothetical protein [Rhodococcus spongiicola]|uniref:Uncharacterized protein n=1 Tax=Rhodococcus spongiicola TaxID=2487352 RepID=A0A3S3AB63_9NOCA|nr:hypothetical protein [Rhodococcus spongiicola]RVW06161.1 hypothetical protein EF834_01490 [Rhodococcus spongiicola]
MNYKASDAVRESPELTRKANELVARWCTAATVLVLIPVVTLTLLWIFATITFPSWAFFWSVMVYMCVVPLAAVYYPQYRIRRLAPPHAPVSRSADGPDT